VTQPAGDPPRRVTLVLGAAAGGMGAHVRMLAAGLAGQGIAVSVAGPSAAGARFSFTAVPGVSFTPVEIGGRPRASDLAVAARLRRLLAGRGSGARGHGAAVVHAHGLRAGTLTVLALLLVRSRRRPGVVVTVHNAPPAGGAAAAVYRVLELVVARGADLVLCVSPDLEQRMRGAGAHRVGRAVIAAAVPASGPGPGSAHGTGRPVVLTVARLARQKGLGTLLDAAVAWQDLVPRPLLLVAGEGPLAAQLRDKATALGVDAEFLGQVAGVPALLAAAAVFVLPSQWEGQPLALQEALRAGKPVVATRVGGIPGLTGEDAALLVTPGDARALAAAVRSVLTDAALAARLRAAAAGRAATLPSPADATVAALSVYAALGPGRSAIIDRCR
jgi:glycosyltransferase involved in cell wall biosynthesis